MSIPLLSFFTGGGFLDMGFELEGFDVVWANENNEAFCNLYQQAHTEWMRRRRRATLDAFIETRPIEELRASTILRQSFLGRKPELFGIIGGPPCPDFSNAGQHAGHKGINGRLTKSYVNLICETKPEFFVLENVAGLARFTKHRQFLKRIEKQFIDAGFTIDKRIINALELGVPQRRERLFLIGIKKRLARRYATTHVNYEEESWFPWPVVKKYKNAVSIFNWPAVHPYGSKPRKPRGIPAELCVGTYMVSKRDRNKISNADNIFNAYSEKFYLVDEGDTSQKSFKRLHRYRYSPTACYGNQEVHLHPWEPRRLSLREAMRIQGIPDSYELSADVSLSLAFKMVSNGVPVPLAQHVAKSMKAVLNMILL